MSKSFEFDLVPCDREPWPWAAPMHDLSENLEMARKILEPLHRFFQFTWVLSHFSGFAREAKPGDPDTGPLFHVQFWTKAGKIWRAAAFRNIGYTGILHVEGLPDDDECDVDFTIERDFISELVYAINEFRALPEGYEETCIPTVNKNEIEFTVPWRTR